LSGKEGEETTIWLPEDENVKLFVLSEASNLALTQMFTDVVYDNEIHVKQITALTRLGRDMETAFQQRLAAIKREKGTVQDIPSESVLKRPPNMVTIIAVSFIALLVVAYGQYSGQLAAWYAGVQANAGLILAGVILLLALVLMLRFRRRSPRT
jgi:LPXTG-motif cell wall-anchored protein